MGGGGGGGVDKGVKSDFGEKMVGNHQSFMQEHIFASHTCFDGRMLTVKSVKLS